MADREKPGRRADALWFACAVALHAGLYLATARKSARPEPAPPAVYSEEFDIDLLLAAEQAEDQPVTSASESAPAPATVIASPAVHREAPAAPAPGAPAVGDAPSAPLEGTPAPASTNPSPPGTQRPIDLGLNGGIMQGAMLEHRFDKAPARAAPPHSVGLLTEGLAQMAAERGQSRSSAAVSASYQSARAFAPEIGVALFDVEADASGAVVSVSLVSEGPDQHKWQRVASDLQSLLAKRKLRIPDGASGLRTRLRIERGQYARDVDAMNRLERGPSMGQGALPPRQAADESTQSSLGLGLTPTLQVYSSEKTARATRVVVVSERAL